MTSRFFASLLLFSLLLIPGVSFAKTKKETGITCQVTASKTLVKPGEAVTISWIGYGALLAYGPSGDRIPLLGSETVTPTKKTIYKFKFLNTKGNEKCGVRIRVEGEKTPE